jgi:hypothetical protein
LTNSCLGAACFWLLMAATGAAHAGLPKPEKFVAQVVGGQIDPEHYDFSAYWRMPKDERTSWYRAVSDLLDATRPGSDRANCESRVMRGWAGALWLRPMNYSGNEEAAEKFEASMRADLTRIDAFVAAAESRVNTAGLEPRVAELFRRQARQQGIEQIQRERDFDIFVPLFDADPPLNQMSRLWFYREWSIECDNAKWLRAQMKEIGWFDIPHYGAAVDEAAWYLVEQASFDRALRHAVVEYLEPLPTGTTSAERLATWWDWTALERHKPFRYGMEGWCWEDGTWRHRDVEDPDNLDARRAARGLKPIAEYNAEMTLKRSCQDRLRKAGSAP